MDTSILIARFLGPVMVIAALSMFVNRNLVASIFEDFAKNVGLIFFAGILALILGLAIVNFHNLWVADWRVIITIFGWLAIAGGVMRMMFPLQLIEVGRRMMEQQTLLIVVGAINLLLGAFLTYVAYLR